MSRILNTRSMLARLRLPALAAALAVAASASHAGAVVNITSFMVTTDGIPFVAPKFAAADSQSSTLQMDATNGGGGASDSQLYLGNWSDSPTNTTAMTSAAVATGNVISFTDALTQFQTGGFNLSASAMASGTGTFALPAMATAAGEQSGALWLIDESGVRIAGTLTFDVFYDLTISPALGGSPFNSSSEASLIFTAFDDESADSVFDMLSGFGPGTTSGHFTMTFQLGADDEVVYTLAGSAVAFAVPEPGSMALAMIGLFAAGASCRRPLRQA